MQSMPHTTELDNNLIPSPKKRNEPEKSKHEEPITTIDSKILQLKKYTKTFALSFLAIFSCILFFIIRVPTERISQNILNILTEQSPFDWTAENVELGFIFGPRIIMYNVSIQPKIMPGMYPQNKTKIDKLVIRPSIFRLIPIPKIKESTPAGSFSLKAFQGEATGSIIMGSKFALEIDAEDIDLEKVDILKQNFNLDIKGKIQSLKLEITSADGRLSKSEGSITLNANAIQFDPAGLNLGMALPILEIGALQLNAPISNGKLMIEHLTLGDSTKDLELQASGSISLREPIMFSDMDLKLKFKPAPKISKAMPYLDGLFSTGKRPDGFYGLRITGPVSAPGMPMPYLEN